MFDLPILYADSDLIAVNKPAGMLSQSTDSGDGLPDLLAAKLREAGQSDRLYPIHRLDREVSGVLLLARTPSAAARLSADMAARKIEKRYRAVVHGRPAEPSGEMFDLLFHDRVKNRSYTVDRMRKGVRDARLEYKVLDGRRAPDFGELTLLEIVLHTGRTHQIRVQCSSRQLPLWGDLRYGLREKGGIALYCRRIALAHPANGRPVEIVASTPKTFPWTLFEGIL